MITHGDIFDNACQYYVDAWNQFNYPFENCDVQLPHDSDGEASPPQSADT